ncbi:hypothetical protein [Psychromonas sp. KJ10-2]|uniref:hypothetical protein n=1 Tax=Psychromonas sp. KJ10-2 TaxID=3391822 RepID=UPI0039B5B0EA
MCKFKQFRQQLIQKLQFFSFEHGQYPSQNLSITIDPITLLALLKGQNNPSGNKPMLYPLIYWQNKEHTHTLASLGSIEVLNHIPNASDQQLYLGGLAFQQQGEQWLDFLVLVLFAL